MIRVLLILCIAGAIPLRAQDCSTLSWEARLTYDANHISSSFVRGSSGVVSDALLPLTIGVPVGLYAYGISGIAGSQENKRYAAETGLQAMVTMGATYAIVLAAKHVFDRDRPWQAHPDCITNYRSDADGSFPSGHSAGSAALATTLALRYKEWYVIAPGALYALWTGFSRLNLGMHYLSDVLVGYGVGIGVAVLVHALNTQLFDLAEPILPTSGLHTIQMGALPGHQPIFHISLSF